MVMGQLTTKTDVAVIGGGPGGYTAAIRAAQLGLDVVLIEKSELGGVCTNLGCIPSKAMIHVAELKHDAEDAGAMGLSADVSLDFKKMQKWKDSVVSELRGGIASLCRANGVEVVRGSAAFASPRTLSVQTDAGLRTIEFGKAVIAAGTVEKPLPALPFDHKTVISSDDVFALGALPKSLLVVGGGYIAAEMACMFARLGSKVTVSYRGERLLKTMEPELSDSLKRGMESLGIEIIFKSEVIGVEGGAANVKTPAGARKVQCDKVLVAVGRELALSGLGLEKTGVKLGKDGRIAVDSTMRTSDANTYAVGDVVPGPQLAHKAFREGKVAAECIAERKSAFDNVCVPMVVFSEPLLASVGMTEAEVKASGRGVKAGRMPFSTSGRAKAIGKKEGFVKVVADGNGILLGVHIAGPGADALIAEAALALEMAATLEDLAATIHAHPTLPETLMEAAEEALGKAIHIAHTRK